MRFPDAVGAPREPEQERWRPDLARDPRALAARIRAELHALVRALAQRDYESALGCLRQTSAHRWDAARLAAALEPFYREHEKIVFTPRARLAEFTRVSQVGSRAWSVSQVLLDPADENFWCLEGSVELPDGGAPEGPSFELRRIGF
jgi:hypothetical protein